MKVSRNNFIFLALVLFHSTESRPQQFKHNRRGGHTTREKQCTTGNDIANEHLDDCLTINKSNAGCSNKKCEKTICSDIGDSFCCTTSWDKSCVESAQVYCTTDLLSSTSKDETKSKSSCYLHSSRERGCDNKKCENIICKNHDSLCCTMSWGWDCVLLAMDHCCLEDFRGDGSDDTSDSESDDSKRDENNDSSVGILLVEDTNTNVVSTVSPSSIEVREEEMDSPGLEIDKTSVDMPTQSPSLLVTSTTTTIITEMDITNEPTVMPTNGPTTIMPSNLPTNQHSNIPSNSPTSQHSNYPSNLPTYQQSSNPSNQPTNKPSNTPTTNPTSTPSEKASTSPTNKPSQTPTESPLDVYCTTTSYYNQLYLDDCVQNHNTKGCANKPCEALICDNDSFCCHSKWDKNCADTANVYCNPLQHNMDQTPIELKSTCFSHSSTESGCDNQKCQNYVCEFNSFCCTSSWSFDCVLLAIDYCCLEDFGLVLPDVNDQFAVDSIDGSMSATYYPTGSFSGSATEIIRE